MLKIITVGSQAVLSLSSCQLAVGEQLAFVSSTPSSFPVDLCLLFCSLVCAMFESFAGVPCSIVIF